MPLDVADARSKFPALAATDQVYFDNAGGSQVLGGVIDSISKYLVNNNVQLGASYKIGRASTARYYEGVQAAADYINCDVDETVIGPSTTQLFRNMSSALRPHFPPGSEIVCSSLDHEANIASWVTLAEDLELKLVWWRPTTPSSRDPQLTPDTLAPLLNPQTRLVTCTHTSNILGTITPIRAIADLVHKTCPSALLCVDAVAYAPHRPIDVRALDVDIYAFSWYKLYGPHVAQLYVRREVQAKCMRSLGHFFKQGATLEDKLGLAAASYELVQSIPAVTEYIAQRGWDGIVDQETQLQQILIDYLLSKPDVFEICGVPGADPTQRVPVISFVVKGKSSSSVVERIESRTNFGFRSGHFYCKRLCNSILNLQGDEGVVRVSLVHYNTVDEIKAFVQALDEEVQAGK